MCVCICVCVCVSLSLTLSHSLPLSHTLSLSLSHSLSLSLTRVRVLRRVYRTHEVTFTTYLYKYTYTHAYTHTHTHTNTTMYFHNKHTNKHIRCCQLEVGFSWICWLLPRVRRKGAARVNSTPSWGGTRIARFLCAQDANQCPGAEMARRMWMGVRQPLLPGGRQC